MGLFRAGTTGTGSYLPRTSVPNERFASEGEELMATLERIGIKSRRWAQEDESLPVMMAVAAHLALEDANLTINDIIGIYVGTNSTDSYLVPSLAARQHYLLGAGKIPAIDVGMGCCGGIAGIVLARDQLLREQYFMDEAKTRKPLHALVVSGDSLSRITSGSDPVSRAILADGVGAQVISTLPEEDLDFGIYHVFARIEGQTELIRYTSGYAGLPSHFKMDGSDVHRFVKSTSPDLIKELFEEAKIPLRELTSARIIPHQVNVSSLNKLPGILKKLRDENGEPYNIPLENIYSNGAINYGNTSGGSTFIGLDEENRGGRIERGRLVVVPSWGAGMGVAGMLARWHRKDKPIRPFEDRTEQERLLAHFNQRYDVLLAALDGPARMGPKYQ